MELNQILFLLLLSVVPAIFLLNYFLRQDKADKEPVRLLWKAFRWGIYIILPAAFIEIAIDDAAMPLLADPLLQVAFMSFVTAGVVEESFKFWVIKKKLYHEKAFNEPMDGIMYAIVASLGFATVENAFYVFGEANFSGALAVGIMRALLSVPGHALFSGIMGYYIGQAKFNATSANHAKRLEMKGLLLAIFFHGLYNFLLSVQMVNPDSMLFILVVPLLLTMFIFLRSKINELQFQTNTRDEKPRAWTTKRAIATFCGVTIGTIALLSLIGIVFFAGDESLNFSATEAVGSGTIWVILLLVAVRLVRGKKEL